MPTFTIFVTNPKSEIPADFLLEASKFIAKQLGKPEMYVTVRVVPDQMMCHGGSTDPCGSIHVASIGALGDRNNEHTEAIGEFLEKQLGIPKTSYTIENWMEKQGVKKRVFIALGTNNDTIRMHVLCQLLRRPKE